jgi:hypothetical protein
VYWLVLLLFVAAALAFVLVNRIEQIAKSVQKAADFGGTAGKTLLALGPPLPSEDSESGINPAVSLLGIFITQVIALYLSQRGQDYLEIASETAIVYYLGIGALLGMILGMLHSTKQGAKGPCRTVEVGSRVILFGLAAFILLAGAIVVPWYAVHGQLLTQTRKYTLEPVSFGPYKFRNDKSLGVAFYVYAGPSKFDGAVPDALNLSLDVERDFNRQWEITYVDAQSSERKDDGTVVWRDWDLERQPSIVEDHSYEVGETSVARTFLRDLAPNENFRLRFSLHARDKSLQQNQAARNAAIAKLKTEKLIQVTAIAPKL